MGYRNAPFVFGVRSAVTAIATGNTAIIKGYEFEIIVLGAIFILRAAASLLLSQTPKAKFVSKSVLMSITRSEYTPKSFWVLGQVFAQAGLPAGVLNIVSCEPSKAAELVTAMIEHPAVKHINFTGSAAVGRKVAITCAQNLKPCLMELGGKNSAIVLPDADLEKAAGMCIAGAFINVSLNVVV